MPFLGKKLVQLVKPLTSIDRSETIYVIKHTGEKFRSKEEYQARRKQYDESVWTCRCTGHVGLTHQEAWESEQAAYKMLKNFPVQFEKPVLEVVHHSTFNLDVLVDQAYEKLGSYLFPDDVVQFKIKQNGSVITGTIVNLENGKYENNSPRSVHEKENLNIGGTSSNQGSPKKTPPKLLPYLYSVKLHGDSKTVSGVPTSDLIRLERTPNKDMMKLFIRAHALRYGTHPNSPWVVETDYVKRYTLPSKFADFLVSPEKMKEVAKMAEVKKRPSTSNKTDQPDAKKKKIVENRLNSTTSIHNYSKSPSKKVVSTPVKKVSPKGKGTPNLEKKLTLNMPLTEISSLQLDHSYSSPKIKLASAKKSPKKSVDGKSPKKPDSPKKTDGKEVKKAKSLKKDITGKGKKKKPDSKKTPKKVISSKAKLLKDKLKKKKALEKKRKDKGKTPKKTMQKKTTSPKKQKTPGSKKDKSPKKKTTKAEKSHKKSPSKNTTPKRKIDSAAKKKLNMKMKKDGIKPKKAATVKKEIIVIPKYIKKLMALRKRKSPPHTDVEKKKMVVWVSMAARELNRKQMAKLKPDIKELVIERKKKLDEIKKFKEMTPEQRKEYNRIKSREKKRQMRAIQLAENRKYEDRDLKNLTPLPNPKLVPTPEGIPNELFGDVSMVCEFLFGYKGLLLTEQKCPVDPALLMKALVSGGEGYAYLSWMVSILLHALLQDQSTQKLTELGLPLSHLVVNQYTSPEILRLVLKGGGKSSSDDDVDSDIADDFDDSDVAEQLVEKLESNELYELEPQEKLQLMVFLCHKLMASDTIQNYMDSQTKLFSQTWNEKTKVEKQLNEERKKLQDQMKKEKKENPGSNSNGEQDNNGDGVTPNSQDGTQGATNDPANDDIASIVKRRQHMTKKAKEEIEKNKQEEKEKKMKEAEGLHLRKQKEMLDKSIDDVRRQVLDAQRHTPLGCDRNHTRYWLFEHGSPMLYLEKGWVNPDIHYRVEYTPLPPPKEEVKDDESVIVLGDSDDDEVVIKSLASKDEDPPEPMETTTPTIGQNLWFCYNKAEEVEQLMKALHPQGIRESALLDKLKKALPDIKRGFNWRDKNKIPELKPCNGGDELVEEFKKELTDVEVRVGQGAMGGVSNFSKWEKKLLTAQTFQDLSQRLLETHKTILTRFFNKNFAPHKPKSKDDSSTSEEVGAEVPSKNGEKWREGVDNASSMSRLHVLLAILDSSILWEKSAENAKCRICRRKGDECKLLLCDQCNLAFHLYCLRPVLSSIPRGEWYCSGCRKPEQNENSRRRRQVYVEDEDESEAEESSASEEEAESSSEESVIEHDDFCKTCKSKDDEDLVECGTCSNSFHMGCHRPPLRYPPRGSWSCMHCTKKKGKHNVDKKGKRKNKKSKSQKRKKSRNS